jgi:hypothetical protein
LTLESQGVGRHQVNPSLIQLEKEGKKLSSDYYSSASTSSTKMVKQFFHGSPVTPFIFPLVGGANGVSGVTA